MSATDKVFISRVYARTLTFPYPLSVTDVQRVKKLLNQEFGRGVKVTQLENPAQLLLVIMYYRMTEAETDQIVLKLLG